MDRSGSLGAKSRVRVPCHVDILNKHWTAVGEGWIGGSLVSCEAAKACRRQGVIKYANVDVSA